MISGKKEGMSLDESSFNGLGDALGLCLAKYVLEPGGDEYFSYLSTELGTLYEIDIELARQDNNVLWALGHPDDLPKIRQAINLSAVQLKPYDQCFRIITPNKKVKWIHGYGKPIKDGSEVIRWDLRFQDVTRFTTLGKVSESKPEIETITENIDGTIIRMVVNDNPLDNMQLQFVSRSIEKLLGRSQKWIIQNPMWLWKIIDPRDLDTVSKEFIDAIYQKVPFDIEFRMKLPGEEVQWLKSTGRPKMHKELGLVYDILTRVITKEKNIEFENNRVISLFEAALNGTFDAFYLLDCLYNDEQEVEDFTFQKVNDVACQQLNMKRSQLIGKRINVLFPVNIESGFFKQYRDVFLTGKTLRQRYEVPQKFAASGWYEQQVVKTPMGVAIFNRDISEEINSTKKIELQKNQLQQTLNDLAQQNFALDQHSIVAITDVKGTITYVNSKFSEISMYSEEELIGQNHRMLNSGYHSREFFQNLYSTIGKGNVWKGEIRNKKKNGEFYWVDTTIIPFTNPDTQKVESYIAIRSDITQRKVFESELVEANMRFEVASKAVSDAIWDWNIKEDIIDYSDGYENSFGYEKGYTGSYKLSIQKLHPDVRSRVKEKLTKSLNNPKVTNWEDHYILQKADGTYAHVHDRGRILRDAQGKAYRMIGAATDVTKRVERQRSIEEQNKRLHEIAWAHSHKTRVPVANIQGLATLIKSSKSLEEVIRLTELLTISVNSLDTEIRNVAKLTERLPGQPHAQ